MRLIVPIAAAFALAACGGQAPSAPAEAQGSDAPAAAAADPARAASTEITDANEMTVEQISARLVGTWRSTLDDNPASLSPRMANGQAAMRARWIPYPAGLSFQETSHP
jgi:hypothetical protein